MSYTKDPPGKFCVIIIIISSCFLICCSGSLLRVNTSSGGTYVALSGPRYNDAFKGRYPVGNNAPFRARTPYRFFPVFCRTAGARFIALKPSGNDRGSIDRGNRAEETSSCTTVRTAVRRDSVARAYGGEGDFVFFFLCGAIERFSAVLDVARGRNVPVRCRRASGRPYQNVSI